MHRHSRLHGNHGPIWPPRNRLHQRPLHSSAGLSGCDSGGPGQIRHHRGPALSAPALHDAPSTPTSDHMICAVRARRDGIQVEKRGDFRAAFFSKGQPRMRASPLTIKLGWVEHHDANAHIDRSIRPPRASRHSSPILRSRPAPRQETSAPDRARPNSPLAPCAPLC